MNSKSDWNRTIEGLEDFGKSSTGKSSDFFLTFEASDYRNAKRLSDCVQEKLKGQFLIAYKCVNGIADRSLVHLYYKNEDFKFPPKVFKPFMEEISGMKCLEMKKVVYKRALLKSMTPWGCPKVYSSKIPITSLGEGCGKRKPKTTASTKQFHYLGQPFPVKKKTTKTPAEKRKKLTDLLAKKEAKVHSLEKSLKKAKTECQKTKSKRRQLNNDTKKWNYFSGKIHYM